MEKAAAAAAKRLVSIETNEEEKDTDETDQHLKGMCVNCIRKDSKLVLFFRAIRPGLGQAGIFNGLRWLGFTHECNATGTP